MYRGVSRVKEEAGNDHTLKKATTILRLKEPGEADVP